MQTVSSKPEGSNEQQPLFLKIYLWDFNAFIWTGQYRVDRKALGGERGEHDRQRTSRRDSNSGRRKCSYDVCRHTNHKAIGANNSVQVNLIWNH